jgi:hypothetical protein
MQRDETEREPGGEEMADVPWEDQIITNGDTESRNWIDVSRTMQVRAMTKLFQACCLDGHADELDNIQARVRHGRYRLHEAEICPYVLRQVKLLQMQMVGERRGDLLARLEEDIDEQIAKRMAWDPTDITPGDWVGLSLSSEGSPVARRVREEEDEEQAMIEERERGRRRRGGEGGWAERARRSAGSSRR